jgi:GGDEF domain-containing protein
LSALAYHDALTGLANRQLLHEHLKQALSLAHRLSG